MSKGSIRTEIEPTTWTAGGLVEMIRQGVISLPRYQRSQVWSEDKKSAFIDSVQSHYPIGSLLVYEQRDSSKKFVIIDGLQRATAFRDYVANPTKYINFSSLVEKNESVGKSFNKLFASLIEFEVILEPEPDAREDFLRMIAEWLNEVNINRIESFTPSKLARSIVRAYRNETDPLNMNTRDRIEDAIDASELFTTLKNALSIDEYSFPVIKYSGDPSNLPDIFERINSQGIRLSKYEVYAATWYSHANRIYIDNEDIRRTILGRHEKVTDDGFQIDELEPAIDDYTLYEYLFGLGQMLANDAKYEILFKHSKNKKSIVPIAFIIACVVYGSRLGDIVELPDVIKRKECIITDEPMNLKRFERALYEAIDFVLDTLDPYIGFKLRATTAIAHTDYQICSFISRALIGRYEVGTWQERTGWKQDRRALKKYIPQHYLYDLLWDVWGNAGDSRLFNSVWQDAANDMPSNQYTRGFTLEEWNGALNAWFSEDMSKTYTKRHKINSVSRVVLKFAYAEVTTTLDRKYKFDIDHLFPIDKLVSHITPEEKRKGGWPLMAIGNLAIMPERINQVDKNKLTLEELFEKYAGTTDPIKKEMLDTVKRYTLLDNPEIYGEEKISDLSHYEEFLRMRNGLIKGCIFKTLGIHTQ